MGKEPDKEYEEFRVLPDRGPAESLSSWLEFEGVPELDCLATGKLPGQD